MASKALSGVHYLKGLVNAEVKKYDVYESARNIPDTGYIYSLNQIALGDGADAQRDGNSIFARHLSLRGVVNWNTTAAVPQEVRVAVILDRQTIVDTAPAYTDIYDNTGTAVAPLSHLTAESVGRFKVLATRTVFLSDQKRSAPVQIQLNMRHHIRFNGALATDYQRGALWLVCSSSEGTNYPVLSWTARLSYHDN